MKTMSDLKRFNDLKEFENEMAHMEHRKTVKGLMLEEDFKNMRSPLLAVAGILGAVVAFYVIRKIKNSRLKISVTAV